MITFYLFAQNKILLKYQFKIKYLCLLLNDVQYFLDINVVSKLNRQSSGRTLYVCKKSALVQTRKQFHCSFYHALTSIYSAVITFSMRFHSQTCSIFYILCVVAYYLSNFTKICYMVYFFLFFSFNHLCYACQALFIFLEKSVAQFTFAFFGQKLDSMLAVCFIKYIDVIIALSLII